MNSHICLHLKRSKVNDRYLGCVPQPHLLFLFLGSSLCLGEALNVRALVGDDVTLSVDTQTSSDISEAIVEWSRTDLNPDIVHRHENRRTIYEHQNPAYRGRTMLSAEDLDRGIISLKLSNVRLADEGNYTCLFKSTENMYSVHLLVGKTGHPPPPIHNPNPTLLPVLVLGCRAKGWYPQPKLSWWTTEGALLPAVTMPANQEEDRLYNISSTLVVERKSPNRHLICRVHQELACDLHMSDLPPPLQTEATSSDIGEAIVEWSRKDLAPDIVHLHENRRTIFEHQNPAYRGRTMLSAEDLEMGIISLKLPNVRQADEGNYTCLFKLEQETTLFYSGLVLDCRAKGWYPEPKLSWWNADGHLLPAVTMTSNQDPDRLYNISSTVEVEWESLSRPFTCRVHQELFNQTRVTEIHLPGRSCYVW
uniref:Ig-like domain-containing protein n=1 Tax=Gadus morhua TaxID=8049 RepID=A0A8C4Z0X8_GADMO